MDSIDLSDKLLLANAILNKSIVASVKKISHNGMMRHIAFASVSYKDGLFQFRLISPHIAKLINKRSKENCIVIEGYGMDMVQYVITSLAKVLSRDLELIACLEQRLNLDRSVITERLLEASNHLCYVL